MSGPIKNAVDGIWQISLSKPIRRNGELTAIISAVISVDLLGVGDHVSPDKTDYITLLDRDFRLIDRVPKRPDDVGRDIGSAQLFSAVGPEPDAAARGVFRNVFTGEERAAVALRFFDGNLVMSSSRPMSSVLLYWKHLAIVSATTSVLLVMMILGAIATMFRETRLRQAHAARLQTLNAALQERTAEAETLAAVKSEFLATMSHEIRTPLTAIMGMHDLCRVTEDIDDLKRHLGVAEGASRVLLGIINDILDSERLEAGRLTLEAIPFNVTAVVQQVLVVVTPQADDKGLAVDVDIQAGSPPIMLGDPSRLCQILINLLGNAVKFTERGRIGLAVRFAPGDGVRQNVRFEVTDTGPGIPADKIDLLFRPFEQIVASRARRSGGSGLGLSICKRLVDAMGGEIGAASAVDVGSKFWFEVDLDRFGGVSAEQSAERPVVMPGDALDVLVVDDNVINRDLVREMLSTFGHRVETASSGQAAIEIAAQRRFDVILLDIQMPEMDGVETIGALKARGLIPRTAVIALTANAMTEQRQEYERAGFDDCALKPIVWPDLLDKMAAGVSARMQPDRAVAAVDAGTGDPGIGGGGSGGAAAPGVDWSTVEELSAVVGAARIHAMMNDAVESAFVIAGDLGRGSIDRAASLHAMRGFLGNLGVRAVLRVLDDCDRGRFDSDQALGQALLPVLEATRAEIALYFETRDRRRQA